MPEHLLVFSTASSKKEARKLSGILLNQRLAACIHILSGVESHYRWKGKKQKGREVLLLIKTRSALFPKLEKTLKAHHSYSVPEIIAVPIVKGSRSYLSWLSSETVN